MTSTKSPAPVTEFTDADELIAADSEHAAIVARQAILDAQHRIIGYELFNRTHQAMEHTLYSDATLLFNVLSLSDAQTVGSEKTLFINCTHDTLTGRHLDLVLPERVVLELPPIEGHQAPRIEACAAVLGELHKRGFRFAFDHTVLSRNYAPWRPYVAYVKLDLEKVKNELIEPLVRYARQHTPAQLIATKVESEAQFERMKAFGITLFQGYWFAQPVLLKSQAIRPAQATIVRLIQLVQSEAEVAQIEEVLKRDPTLSFTLLKYINSSGFGLNCSITSFRHAVMLLGMKKLFRWAALLLTMTKPGGTAPAVGGTAVVRGRLMELLAAEVGALSPQDCDSAFVVGVFSLLDVMLGMPMLDAVKAISLPDAVTQALLHGEGVFAPLLRLTQACESGDEEVFARVATQLGLSNRQVNWAHLQALAWAETLAA